MKEEENEALAQQLKQRQTTELCVLLGLFGTAVKSRRCPVLEPWKDQNTAILFPMLLLLSGIPSLVKLDTVSQPLQLKPL